MDLVKQVAYAAIEGVSRVLPVSASGHRVAASVWLGDVASGTALAEIATLGCLAALVVVVRVRLATAFTEGIRGIARPSVLQSQVGGRDAVAIAVGSVVAIAVEMALAPMQSGVNETPTVAAAGLLLTALGLASTHWAPAPRQLCPSALGAAFVGLAHGLAVLPGASQVGAAFIVLRWLAVSGWRSAEMAILVSLPSLTLGVLRLFGKSSTGALGAAPSGGELALAVTVAFVTASLAASWWKALCEREGTPWLGLWLVPLALALVGYGRALPHPTDPLPLSAHPARARGAGATWGWAAPAPRRAPPLTRARVRHARRGRPPPRARVATPREA